MNRTLWCAGGVAIALSAAAGSSWGSAPAPSWTLTNLVKVARQRFPAYVGISVVRLTDRGAVYWTANRQYSDGRTLEVFRWQNGIATDLGSPGRNLVVAGVNDRGQFIVDTAPPPWHSMPIPVRKGARRSSVSPPPTHAYLWQQGRLIPLGSLGGTNAAAAAINGRGQVVGSSQIHEGSRAPFHAFLWENGKMTDLGTLGGRFSDATAINDHGQVIGQSDTANMQLHGFIWQRGRITDLGTLGGNETRPLAINELGQVIGQSTTPKGTAHHFDNGAAFEWQDGAMTDLGTLTLKRYPGYPPRSTATAINDQGEVVGTTQTFGEIGHAFLWRDGKLTDLGTLGGGLASAATAIDDRGRIVGWSYTRLVPYTAQSQPRPRPFLWQSGKMTELPTDFASPTRATAISATGTEILGAANWPGHQALLWTRGG